MPIDIETCPSLTLFTSAETAQLLRLSNASIRRFALDGRLHAVPGIGKLMFTAEALRAFLNAGVPSPPPANGAEKHALRDDTLEDDALEGDAPGRDAEAEDPLPDGPR